VDIFRGAQTDAAFLTISPNGRNPAIEHDGLALFESGAIMLYLTGLAGATPPSPRLRHEVQPWLF